MDVSAVPAREGAIDLADGRRLAYAEFGDLDGAPALLLHGNPGSRLICPDVAATAAAGVRLIGFDRPGFGGSDPTDVRDLGANTHDLRELRSALGIDACPLVGWSGGGPYALAAAVQDPDAVTSISLVSTMGLPDHPLIAAQRTAEGVALIEQLLEGTEGAFEALLDRVATYGERPTMILDGTLADEGDPDRRLMQQEPVASALSTMWLEGARQGSLGLALGWAALWALPWGFDPTEVRVPVTAWHGTADQVVPLEHATDLVARLPTATLTTYEGEGHLVAVEHWPEILGAL